MRRAASEEFRHLPRSFPPGVRWFGTVTQMGAAAILLGDAEVAADLFELTAPIAHYYSGDGSGAVYSHGANAPVGELALSRLGLARALLASSGSLVEAAALAAEAASEFRRLDMPARASEAARLVADIADRRRSLARDWHLAPKRGPRCRDRDLCLFRRCPQPGLMEV